VVEEPIVREARYLIEGSRLLEEMCGIGRNGDADVASDTEFASKNARWRPCQWMLVFRIGFVRLRCLHSVNEARTISAFAP
jgi:hypothetical protein